MDASNRSRYNFQDNMDLDLFYDQESRKFSEHGYIGLYKDKSIRAIGKLKKDHHHSGK